MPGRQHVSSLHVHEALDGLSVDDGAHTDTRSDRNVRERLDILAMVANVRLRDGGGIHIRVEGDGDTCVVTCTRAVVTVWVGAHSIGGDTLECRGCISSQFIAASLPGGIKCLRSHV